MNLNDLQKSVTQMTQQELIDLHRSIRMARRSAPKALAKEARGETVKKSKTAIKKELSLQEQLAALSPEEATNLLKMLQGGG